MFSDHDSAVQDAKTVQNEVPPCDQPPSVHPPNISNVYGGQRIPRAWKGTRRSKRISHLPQQSEPADQANESLDSPPNDVNVTNEQRSKPELKTSESPGTFEHEIALCRTCKNAYLSGEGHGGSVIVPSGVCTDCLVSMGYVIKCARLSCAELLSRKEEHDDGIKHPDGFFWLCIACSSREDLVFAESQAFYKYMPFMDCPQQPAIAWTIEQWDRTCDLIAVDHHDVPANQLILYQGIMADTVRDCRLEMESGVQRLPRFADQRLQRLCFERLRGYCPLRIYRVIDIWNSLRMDEQALERQSLKLPYLSKKTIAKRNNRKLNLRNERCLLEKELIKLIERLPPTSDPETDDYTPLGTVEEEEMRLLYVD